MKISVSNKRVAPCSACDVAVYGFGAMGEVNYASELSGASDRLDAPVRLSRRVGGVICACITDSRGALRKSAAVCEGGRLLGISDMYEVFDDEEYKSGAGANFYMLGGYRVGVCIENDLYNARNFERFSQDGCNLAVVVCSEIKSPMPPLLIRAYAYLYGIPIVMSAGNMAYFADITGAIASSGQKSTIFETTPRNYYRVVTVRRRGLFPDVEDY